jgi:hypothetical protein
MAPALVMRARGHFFARACNLNRAANPSAPWPAQIGFALRDSGNPRRGFEQASALTIWRIVAKTSS